MWITMTGWDHRIHNMGKREWEKKSTLGRKQKLWFVWRSDLPWTNLFGSIYIGIHAKSLKTLHQRFFSKRHPKKLLPWMGGGGVCFKSECITSQEKRCFHSSKTNASWASFLATYKPIHWHLENVETTYIQCDSLFRRVHVCLQLC